MKIVHRLFAAIALAMLCCLPAPVAAGAQESLKLVTANVAPATAQIAYGGNYIFAQTCTAYGTLNLQVLGPDGSTYVTVVSKTAADTTGGTAIAIQALANVKATITGTTGCYATLTRVPG